MTEPRNFSWFVEGRLAGMAYPKETDIPFLAQSGIKTLVNMTRDDYYSEVAEANGVAVHTIYVPDFEQPSLHQINDFLEIVDATKEVYLPTRMTHAHFTGSHRLCILYDCKWMCRALWLQSHTYSQPCLTVGPILMIPHVPSPMHVAVRTCVPPFT